MLSPAWALSLAASLLGQEPERRPVPEAAALKEAEELVRGVFKDDYAKKSPSDRVLLARKLLDQAIASSEAPSKYVLLREARDLATGAGDSGLAFEAVESMIRAFLLDPVQLRSSTLSLLAANVKSSGEMSGLARACVKLADEAAASEEFSEALKAVDMAAVQAKKAKDVALVSWIAARRREISELRDASRAVQKARDTLAVSPDDPAANLAVGQYECLRKGDWTSGLPRLAKGSGALGALASRDYASPKDPTERASIGDDYLQLSEKESGVIRDSLRARALHWYEASFPSLTGLNKAKVEKRLSDLRLERFKGSWVDVADPKAFGMVGAPGDPIVLTPPATSPKVALLSKAPEGDYDGVSVRVKVGDRPNAKGSLHYERNKRGVILDFKNGRVQRARQANGGWIPEWEGDVGKRETYMLTILLEFGEYVFYVDSREVAREQSPFTRLFSLSLQADHGPVSFDQFKMRKKE